MTRKLKQTLASTVAAVALGVGIAVQAEEVKPLPKEKIEHVNQDSIKFFASKAFYDEQERLLPQMSDANFKKKMDNFLQQIEGSPEEKKKIEVFLNELASDKEGRLLLERAEDNLTFCYDNLGKDTGVCARYVPSSPYKKEKNPSIALNREILMDDPFALLCLGHEIRHSVQSKENRKNNGQEGITGYTDYVTRKLPELETHLFDVLRVEQAEKLDDKNDPGGTARYFRDIKEKYIQEAEKNGVPPRFIDAYALRKAKTEYVKDVWEFKSLEKYRELEVHSPKDEKTALLQKVATRHGGWNSGYDELAKNNDQVESTYKTYEFSKNNNTGGEIDLNTLEGTRSVQAEKELIDKFTREMGVDIDADYFRNPRNSTLFHEEINSETGAQSYFNEKEVRSYIEQIRSDIKNLKTDEARAIAEFFMPNALPENSADVKKQWPKIFEAISAAEKKGTFTRTIPDNQLRDFFSNDFEYSYSKNKLTVSETDDEAEKTISNHSQMIELMHNYAKENLPVLNKETSHLKSTLKELSHSEDSKNPQVTENSSVEQTKIVQGNKEAVGRSTSTPNSAPSSSSTPNSTPPSLPAISKSNGR